MSNTISLGTYGSEALFKLKMEITFFKNIWGKAEMRSLETLINEVKSGKYQNEIQKLRKAKGGSAINYKIIKDGLPAFTPSGQFNGSHKLENLVEYNPVIVLDIDKVGEDKALEIRNVASKVDHTLAAFISPSGDGVKILVATNSTLETHESVYKQLTDYYESILRVDVDKSGKNANRLCFISHDPELYFNPNASQFQQNVNITAVPEFTKNPYSDDVQKTFENVVVFTEKHSQYVYGNRNNFLFLLANNMNRAGLDIATAEALILSKYTDTDIIAEIPKAVESAFKHAEEHATFSGEYFRTVSPVTSVTTINGDNARNTPIIPDELFKDLPDFLQKGTHVFEIKRERDVFFIGAITVLSGCFPKVFGIYDGREVYCNLNSFTIAPPASGKGVLIYSRTLASSIHDLFKAAQKEEGLAGIVQARNLPITLFIPADSSSAAVKRTLSHNGGIGIICETEAETLTSTFGQDWGGYTNILLKGFQHETIEFGRAGDNNEVNLEEIACPKLSVCLSGTPHQVHGLMKSVNDGLFSRFIFYNYNHGEKPIFKNVFKTGEVTNLTTHFNELAEDVLTFYNKVNEKEKVEIKITEEQETSFSQYFNKMVSDVYDLFGDESMSTVMRLGLIAFRVMMLLTVLRKIEKDELNDELFVEDVDFNIALALAGIFLEHALSVYKVLPGTVQINPNARILAEFLPPEFTYTEAVRIGVVILGFSEKTVYNYLKELLSVKLIRQYQKNGPYYNNRLQ